MRVTAYRPEVSPPVIEHSLASFFVDQPEEFWPDDMAVHVEVRDDGLQLVFAP